VILTGSEAILVEEHFLAGTIDAAVAHRQMDRTFRRGQHTSIRPMVVDDVVQALAGQFLSAPADQALAFGIEVGELAVRVERVDAFAEIVEDGAQPGFLPVRGFLQRFLRRDFGADGDVFLGLAALVHERRDGGVHPVEAARLVAIADFAIPGAAIGDGAPHVLIDLRRMRAGFEDAVVLAQSSSRA
jgi:hypothetical protein